MKHWFIPLLMVLEVGVARADTVSGDAATIGVARTYLDAYQRLDVRRLEELYADNVEFNDPTSLGVSGIGGPFVWHGRDAVLAGIRRWARSVRSLHYDLERVYEASGRVVFIGAVNPVIATPNGSAQYRYSIVTIVTINGGRVIEHRDYTDYSGAVQVPTSDQRRGRGQN